jgi:hypothetical protein
MPSGCRATARCRAAACTVRFDAEQHRRYIFDLRSRTYDSERVASVSASATDGTHTTLDGRHSVSALRRVKGLVGMTT